MKLKEAIVATAICLAPTSLDAQSEAIIAREGSGAVYEKGRHSGERDLVNIASNSCSNDLWIYNSGKWHDIGLIANGEPLRPDIPLIESILRESSSDIYSYEIRHRQCRNIDESLGISLQPISTSSILFHAYLSDMAADYGKRVYSRVVDEHGVWRYSISNRLAESLLEFNAEAFDAIEGIAYDASRWLLDVPRSILGLRLEMYQERMQSAGVYVSYQQMR